MRPRADRGPSHSVCSAPCSRPEGERRIHSPSLPAAPPGSSQLRRRSLVVGRGRHRSPADRARTLAAIEMDILVSCDRVGSRCPTPSRLQRRRSSWRPWTETPGTGSTKLNILIARALDFFSSSLRSENRGRSRQLSADQRTKWFRLSGSRFVREGGNIKCSPGKIPPPSEGPNWKTVRAAWGAVIYMFVMLQFCRSPLTQQLRMTVGRRRPPQRSC
jgi:hypothetical protein